MDPKFLLFFLVCLLVVSSGQITVPAGNPVTVNPTPANTPVIVTPGTTNPPGAGGQPVTSPSPTGTGGGPKWCVVKSGAAQAKLQTALDYACGMGKADCSAIQQSGSCYNPNTLQNHASYAFNSYFQKNPAGTSCDFGGAAVVTTVNPSTGSCVFPTSSSSSSSSSSSAPPTTPTSTGAITPPSGSGTSNSPAIMNGNGGGGRPGLGGVFPTGVGENPTNATTDTSASSGSPSPLIGWIVAAVAVITRRVMNFGHLEGGIN